MCHPGIHVWLGDDGTNRDTTENVQVCENSWMRIVGVRRRMGPLRVEVGVKKRFKKKWARRG